ncbi:hypothetical protein ACFC1R_35125 [Kitasatospora sp. NPDC056138]|uniref:DUF6891 domain-containing protein n=1 Tax=Kitasatospora sp. NPDC056138 TaxID=3345724 RepID=UPI0035E19430
MNDADAPRLPVSLLTEDGGQLDHPTEVELRALLSRIGGPGDHYVVAERIPAEPQVFLQTWREADGPFEVEYRDGSEDQYGVRATDPAALAGTFLAWAGGDPSWAAAHDWRRLDLTSTPGLTEETRAQARAHARTLLRGGFLDFRAVAVAVSEMSEPGEGFVTVEQAGRILGPLWDERLAEQESWPEVTDADRLARAFATLEERGVVARMNFACCGRCGHDEMQEFADGRARGYVFFHSQDTDRAAAGHGLWLAYGAYGPEHRQSGRDAAIGVEVVAALTEAGLPAVWDGSPDSAVRVAPLDWRRRLPQ